MHYSNQLPFSHTWKPVSSGKNNTSPHFPKQGFRRHMHSSVSSYATCVHGSPARDKIYTMTHYIFMGIFVQEILTIRNAARRLRQSSPIFLCFSPLIYISPSFYLSCHFLRKIPLYISIFDGEVRQELFCIWLSSSSLLRCHCHLINIHESWFKGKGMSMWPLA